MAHSRYVRVVYPVALFPRQAGSSHSACGVWLTEVVVGYPIKSCNIMGVPNSFNPLLPLPSPHGKTFARCWRDGRGGSRIPETRSLSCVSSLGEERRASASEGAEAIFTAESRLVLASGALSGQVSGRLIRQRFGPGILDEPWMNLTH